MKNTLLAAVAVSFALSSGIAFAQQADMQEYTSSIPQNYAPFFTDETMATARTAEENRATYSGMEIDDQAALRDECGKSGELDGVAATTDEATEPMAPTGWKDLCAQVSSFQ